MEQGTIGPLRDYASLMLHLEITGQCRLRCKYCYNSGFNQPDQIRNELSIEEVRRIIRQAKRMGYRRFSFSGGEPFLKKSLAELLDECSDVEVIVFTSASVSGQDWMELIVNHPQIKILRVSLDGLSTNDQVRVGSNWRSILESIQQIKDRRRIIVYINTILSGITLKELVPFYHQLKAVKPDRWSIDIATFTGRAQDPDSRSVLDIAFDEVARQFGNLVKAYLSDDQPFRLSIRGVYDSSICVELSESFQGMDEIAPLGPVYPMDIHPCFFERVTAIRPNGDITRCPSHNEVLSNIREFRSLCKALEASFEHPFYKYRLSDFIQCGSCRYIRFCGAGCRANARYLTGSEMNPDPLSCTLASLAEEFIWKLLPPEQKVPYLALVNQEGTRPATLANLLEVIENGGKKHVAKI